jgi:hypothetical protein
MPLIVALQAVVIAGLGTRSSCDDRRDPPAATAEYRTLSSPPEVAGAETSVRLRLVVEEGMTTRELTALLESVPARIVDGPSELGVFTIEVVAAAGSNANPDALALAKALRSSPGVRFAEPTNGARVEALIDVALISAACLSFALIKARRTSIRAGGWLNPDATRQVVATVQNPRSERDRASSTPEAMARRPRATRVSTQARRSLERLKPATCWGVPSGRSKRSAHCAARDHDRGAAPCSRACVPPGRRIGPAVQTFQWICSRRTTPTTIPASAAARSRRDGHRRRASPLTRREGADRDRRYRYRCGHPGSRAGSRNTSTSSTIRFHHPSKLTARRWPA